MSTSTLTGHGLIAGHWHAGHAPFFTAQDPRTGEALQPRYGSTSSDHLHEACEQARRAFDPFRLAPLTTRMQLLEGMAERLLGLGDVLIERAMAETGLPRARLEGERQRTVHQLRLFATHVGQGHWLGARLDAALPDRQPLPRPELRQMRVPLGPVAVFGASNFPLAFSVAGGDTAAALAAGCPVVVKAHPAHPGTSELVAQALSAAVQDAGLPAGVFSLVFDAGHALGLNLVAHSAIKAVGFTGSRTGGLALMAAAARRHEPIPVFAEMSSVNPVLLLPDALAHRGEALATAWVDSLLMGAGQFCTNPGLVLGIEGPALAAFRAAASAALAARTGGTMLTAGIAAACRRDTERLSGLPGVQVWAQGATPCGPNEVQPQLLGVAASTVLRDPRLTDEVFGPTALLVSCDSLAEMQAVIEGLEGQLTATLLMDEGDVPAARTLLPVLERKVGRILANGFPTGVEVCDAMVHGGPFPATSDGRSTSVGTAAIERFLRPVCYQNLPASLWPEALQDGNPLNLWRYGDGVPSQGAAS